MMWSVFGRAWRDTIVTSNERCTGNCRRWCTTDIPVPTPIVRQLPSRVHGGEWDERELIHHGDFDWVVVRDVTIEPKSSILWN